jgi:hypothetical protein
MKYSEILYRWYREKIETWDWASLSQSCGENPQWDDGDGHIIGRAWLGSVLSIMPSGKIHTQWTSNQGVRDVIRDKEFMRALEYVAENHGLFIEEFSDELFVSKELEDGQDAFFWRDRDRDHHESGWYQDGEMVARNLAELEEYRRTTGGFSGLFTESCHGNLSYVTNPEKLDGYEQDDELPDIANDAFARAYVECALLPLGDYDVENLSISAVWRAYRDCRDFRISALDVYFEEEQAGQDFWLARNCHGKGFLEHPDLYGQEVSEKLTEAAEGFGEQHVYVNDESEVEIG